MARKASARKKESQREVVLPHKTPRGIPSLARVGCSGYFSPFLLGSFVLFRSVVANELETGEASIQTGRRPQAVRSMKPTDAVRTLAGNCRFSKVLKNSKRKNARNRKQCTPTEIWSSSSLKCIPRGHAPHGFPVRVIRRSFAETIHWIVEGLRMAI